VKIRWLRKVFARLIDSDPWPPAPMPALADVVEQARREWLSAQNYYNSVSDVDLVDYAVYLMQAAEKKYIYLLKMARREGITYSPYQ
jgi:Protein of unknown function (DUF2508).